MSTFESTVKHIPHCQQSVYATLSDLSNLQALKDGIEQNRDRLPKEALEHIDKLQDLKFDTDSLSIQAPMVGEIKLRIIGREPLKTIKFETENSPNVRHVVQDEADRQGRHTLHAQGDGEQAAEGRRGEGGRHAGHDSVSIAPPHQ